MDCSAAVKINLIYPHRYKKSVENQPPGDIKNTTNYPQIVPIKWPLHFICESKIYVRSYRDRINKHECFTDVPWARLHNNQRIYMN